ncbi:MAG: hypothetical protein ACYCWW_10720 [Deltaproteobacteria bacterium]
MRERRRYLPLTAALIAVSCTGIIGGPGGTGGGSSGTGTASAGASSGGVSGTSGGGTGGGGSTGGGGTGASQWEAVAVSAYVAKVKNLLTGLPPTDAEVAAVTADSTALAGLIQGWIHGTGTGNAATQAGYQAKMLTFFATAFQQTEVTSQDFFSQGFNGAAAALPNPTLMQDATESFARTALELVAEGQPFTSTVTTQRFMLTPALMMLYAFIDSHSRPDTLRNGMVTTLGNEIENYVVESDGGFAFSVEQSGGPIPIAESLSPDSGYYMQFYVPNLTQLATNGCYADPKLFDATSQGKSSDARQPDLYSILAGRFPQTRTPDGGLCPGFGITASDVYLEPSDYATWGMVNIRPPGPGEQTTRFYDLVTLRNLAQNGGDLVLNLPRVGFFTTPAFLAEWNTNASNQARVTINQTLITALGYAFDGTDTRVPPTDGGLDALDQAHIGTDGGLDQGCFLCHQAIDPMRQFFRQSYSLNFTAQTLPEETGVPAFFPILPTYSQGMGGVADLATLLAAHPLFAPAWVERLCEWATSASCDQTDPAFQQIAADWQKKSFDWNALVVELMSSPLVTYAASTQTAAEQGETVSIARQAHLCALLSERLGIADVCGLLSTTPVSGTARRTIQTIAAGYSMDEYSRGGSTPLLTATPNLFMRAGLENLCIQAASLVVDADGGYPSANPTAAIQAMASGLMGLTSDRSGPAVAILENDYESSLDAGLGDGGKVTPRDALESTFVLACESPWVAGVGL